MMVLRAPREVTEEHLATYFSTKVANAPAYTSYKGKCDATFDDVWVERHWEWGLLADDLAIVFRCGPQRFRFETTRAGGENFPWRLLDAKGGSGAWVMSPIKQALETIYHHWTDEARFQPAARVIIDALQYDVETYCRLKTEYTRKKLVEGGGIGAFLGSAMGRSR